MIKEIMQEEEENVYAMYRNAVEEERSWAEYLFKNGSMIGLNDKLLCQYVEYIAQQTHEVDWSQTNLRPTHVK